MAEENYSKFICPGGRGMLIDSMATLLSPCLYHPDEYLKDGISLKNSVSTTVASIKLNNNTDIFVKRYNNKGLRYTLRYLFRPTRPFRVMQVVKKLNELNIPTPNILAALSMRKFFIIPSSSYVFHEYWTDTLSTKEYYKLLYNDQDFFNEFCGIITSYLAKMHQAGMRHKDLKLSNICCRRGESGYIFGFWDLDGIKIFKSTIPPDEYIHIDIARLISSWINHGKNVKRNSVRPDIVNSFTQHYTEHRNFMFDLEKLDKYINRFLERKKRNKKR